MTAKMTIKAEENQLGRIFSDDYLFEIPDYQRPYAWTTEQSGELLDDLLTAVSEAKGSSYFLGSIVLIKDPNEAPAAVVDGQQRLTTLTILFCVLRELTEADGHRDELDTYVRARGKPLAGIRERFRLSLRERDRDIFRDNVQQIGRLQPFVNGNRHLPDSQRRIRENARYLWDKLARADQAEREQLAKFLIRNCYLVVVSASDQDSAYRIFSVMNDRGLNLSPTDILKAGVIGGIEADRRAAYTNKWEAIEEDLGREDFRDLFAHIRMIHVKSKARGNLSREFREGVLQSVSGVDFIDHTLTPMANAYRIVSRAAYEHTVDPEAVNQHLRNLGRIDNFDWIPPAMAYFCRHRHDHEMLAEFVRDLERLAYAMFILRSNINSRIRRYSGFLQAIEQGMDLRSEASRLQLLEEEKKAVRGALDGPIYLQTRVCLPLLLQLDSLLAEPGATYEQKVLSVEHVLPQAPGEGSDWLDWFPEPEQREMWTHRLANLVLLSRRKNSQAQNFDFERKKKEYFQRNGVATFAITSQVLNRQDWTPDVLAERQEELTGRLAEEWRL